MPTNLTTSELLNSAAHALAGTSDTPELDAQVLLAHVLGTGRARLISHAEEGRSDAECAAYERLIEKRTSGDPVAYIVGFKEFWSLRLAVSRAVLVPRPETELLVEQALSRSPKATARALDLGTGAGGIALALAHERPSWRVTATDVSEAALAIARVNALALHLPQTEFLHGSWFDPLPGRVFDLILSNPPYVAKDDPALAARALRCEPRGALTSGADGFADLRHIIRAAPAHLARGGWLLLEHGAAQGGEVARELVARGFRHVRSRRDLAGHERMTEGRWGANITNEA